MKQKNATCRRHDRFSMTESFFLLLLQKRHRAAAADLLFSSSVSLSLTLTHAHPFTHGHTHTQTHSHTHARTHGPAQVREEHTIDASTCAALTHFSRNSRTHTRASLRAREDQPRTEKKWRTKCKKKFTQNFFSWKKNLAAVLLRETFRKKIRDFLLAFSFPMFVRDLLPRSNLMPAGNPRHPRMNKWLDANFVSQSQPNDWLIICLNEWLLPCLLC